jgi:hypothetical protein
MGLPSALLSIKSQPLVYRQGQGTSRLPKSTMAQPPDASPYAARAQLIQQYQQEKRYLQTRYLDALSRLQALNATQHDAKQQEQRYAQDMQAAKAMAYEVAKQRHPEHIRYYTRQFHRSQQLRDEKRSDLRLYHLSQALLSQLIADYQSRLRQYSAVLQHWGSA